MFGDDDFDFIPDMDGDDDHDLIDFMILDTILSEDEKREEEEDDDIFSTSDVDDDDWRDEHDEGYEFDVDPYDYDTEDEYLEALEEAKHGWRETYADDSDFDIDPEDYETEEEYLEALEEAKVAWRDTAEDGSDYGIFADEYETAAEYKQALHEAKYAWRNAVEDGTEYGLSPDDFDTEDEYNDALDNAREGANDWREKYKDNSPNPAFYRDEATYLIAVEERKYAWRKYCSNRFGIDASNFETREEYNAAVNAAYDEERRRKIAEHEADPTNMKKYKFCKVSIDYPKKPFYYYFPGKYKLEVGDRVIVPFGQTNKATEGIVMAVGECFGCALPCKVDFMKFIESKIEIDSDDSLISSGPFQFKSKYDCVYGLGKTYQTECVVSKISVEMRGTTAIVSFLVEKTFDIHGPKSNTNAFARWRIKDSDGIIQGDGAFYSTLFVGDKSREHIQIYNVNPKETYILEFLDHE